MVDFISKEKRSKIMSSIKSKNTTIEKKMAKLLKDAGIKFKKNPKMSGNPDLVLKNKKIRKRLYIITI